MAKTDAPTLFQVNGPVGLAAWKDYCYDLSDTELYKQLTSDSFALKDGDKVAGVAYVIETYGLIYNKALLNEYIAKDYAVIEDAAEINNFDTLKAVAEDITVHKDDLLCRLHQRRHGLLFRLALQDPSANLPVYYEYQPTASPPLSHSRAPTWRTTRTCGICTSITPPVSLP